MDRQFSTLNLDGDPLTTGLLTLWRSLLRGDASLAPLEVTFLQMTRAFLNGNITLTAQEEVSFLNSLKGEWGDTRVEEAWMGFWRLVLDFKGNPGICLLDLEFERKLKSEYDI
ncbi:putative protein S7B [Pilchard orthomyxovirus]|uniref:Uncharacterized protein n=1 Tax=Pilchard orthomyxovirus TaxID=2732827 RepID=A0A6M4ALL5_9ORTO|nr:putative protein S7B [Pilchard orthomyxovirus]QJQ28597.1 putative protein S7B [Pilchard orthomyxovirus]QJQ28607.1 putative protein S7B [Pilchard orthomyxovirus]QJQ28617.1 putative protein S7B [Pilchard orthomyxovirus]QJQ28627.1 putative protein S7B [Pilchard orthomyxovirus]QJQ28637.1 putative protein S7B [Pilchard orthomyxovirus]